MTTLQQPAAPAVPMAPSLRQREQALTRLGVRIFNGAPREDVAVYGVALAHPGLSPDRVRQLIHNVGTCWRSLGRPELGRRALFTLLAGPDTAPCGPCVLDRRRPAHLISPAGECDAHSLGASA